MEGRTKNAGIKLNKAENNTHFDISILFANCTASALFPLSHIASWDVSYLLCEHCGPHIEISLSLGRLCAFVLQLIKTHNLLPSRNYIFGYHPHGILCFGAFCNFGTEATGFSKKFPGIKPSLATLAGNFRMPVLRDYLMSGGETRWEAMGSPLDSWNVC